MLRFTCSHCDVRLRCDDTKAGTRTTCPGCRQAVDVPAALLDTDYVAPARSSSIWLAVVLTPIIFFGSLGMLAGLMTVLNYKAPVLAAPVAAAPLAASPMLPPGFVGVWKVWQSPKDELTLAADGSMELKYAGGEHGEVLVLHGHWSCPLTETQNLVFRLQKPASYEELVLAWHATFSISGWLILTNDKGDEMKCFRAH